jgi:hypothetical protein
MKLSDWNIKPVFLLCCLLALVATSCKQYEYSSPTPGIIDVRLKVKLDDPSKARFIPFGPIDSLGQPRNLFGITLFKLQAVTGSENLLDIYSDIYAIRRDKRGYRFNCLDTLARDGAYVLGTSYAPPRDYYGMSIEVTPDPRIIVPNGASFNVFDVRYPSGTIPLALHRLSTYGSEALNFKVLEGRITRVTITFDLDSSLVRRTEYFEYQAHFYVSSIEYL